MYLDQAAAKIADSQKKIIMHYGFDVLMVDSDEHSELYSILPKGSIFTVGALRFEKASDYHGFRVSMHRAWDGKIAKDRTKELSEESLWKKVDVSLLDIDSVEELRSRVAEFITYIQPPSGPYITRNIEPRLMQRMYDCGVQFLDLCHLCQELTGYYLLVLPSGWSKRCSSKEKGFNFVIIDADGDDVCYMSTSKVRVARPFAKKYACTKLLESDDEE